MLSEYLPIRKAVKEINFTGVTYDLIRQMCADGMDHIKPGRAICVRIEDVEEYLKTYRRQPSKKTRKTERVNNSVNRLKKKNIG